ncbi:MAG: cytochrome c [Saprospiraceae bacterium]|nr:cytochrome c [Saprospiraceae bacterium]
MKKISYFLLVGYVFASLISCQETTYVQGKRLYIAKCQNCHMEDGSGLGGLIPSISVSTQLGSPYLACIIRKGIQDTIFNDTTYLVKEMPAFKKLSAPEIANIINYINSTWHKPFVEITILEIDKALKNCDP